MNLLVIGLCMWVFHYFIQTFHDRQFMWSGTNSEKGIWSKLHVDLNFILLVLSVVLVAAAGNIINDYFDVRADRVNKPERLIVGKHIKRRWAMLFHWSFSSLGTLIAAYLSWVIGNWWLVILSIVTVNILWFYSSVYKRKFLSGNIMVASLLGLVPIYVYLYNLNHIGVDCELDRTVWIDSSDFIFKVVFMLAGIAFLINLIREFIKDIADVRGDLKLGSKSLPISLGIKKTKTIIIIVSVILLAAIALYGYYSIAEHPKMVARLILPIPNNVGPLPMNGMLLNLPIDYFMYCLGMSVLCILIGVSQAIISGQRKRYIIASNVLKLAMLFGLVSPLFL